MGQHTGQHTGQHLGDRFFTVADTSADEVTAILRSTGSSDADVLFAATTEFGRPFRNQKLFGLIAIGAGAGLGLTVIMVAAGVPLAITGLWLWHKGNRNTAVIAAAYTAYMATLATASAAVRPVAPPLNDTAKTG